MINGVTSSEEASMLTAEMNAPGSYCYAMRELLAGDNDLAKEYYEHPAVWMPRFFTPEKFAESVTILRDSARG